MSADRGDQKGKAEITNVGPLTWAFVGVEPRGLEPMTTTLPGRVSGTLSHLHTRLQRPCRGGQWALTARQ